MLLTPFFVPISGGIFFHTFCGTGLAGNLHPALRAGLVSAVPVGTGPRYTVMAGLFSATAVQIGRSKKLLGQVWSGNATTDPRRGPAPHRHGNAPAYPLVPQFSTPPYPAAALFDLPAGRSLISGEELSIPQAFHGGKGGSPISPDSELRLGFSNRNTQLR